jgi:hypothetical protein
MNFSTSQKKKKQKENPLQGTEAIGGLDYQYIFSTFFT